MEDKKHAEAAQKRVDAKIADELHRKKRAQDSYKCYLAYTKIREEERNGNAQTEAPTGRNSLPDV